MATTGASPEIILKQHYSYEGDVFYLGMTFFFMQNKDRVCPFAKDFFNGEDVVDIERKFHAKEKHRDPEPEYGQDFIELFDMMFDYDRNRRATQATITHV